MYMIDFATFFGVVEQPYFGILFLYFITEMTQLDDSGNSDDTKWCDDAWWNWAGMYGMSVC